MKFLSTLFFSILLLISCESSNNPTSDDYFVDWTVNGSHYRYTSTSQEVGQYIKLANTLNILAKNSNTSSIITLSGGIDSCTSTGSYNNVNTNQKPKVGLTWENSETTSDQYGTIPNSGATMVFNITSLTGKATGTFKGKIAQPTNNGTSYKFIDISGSFSIPVY